MKKIKILRIIARLNIGGPAIHTILLTQGLNSGEFESKLAAGAIGDGEADMMYLAQSKGVEPLIIPELGREISLKNDIAAFSKLYRLMKSEKPDIVHTHTAKAGTLGRLAALCAGVPVKIHTFHGHVLYGYFSKVKSLFFITIECVLSIFTDKIIAVSPQIRQDLIKFGIADKEKIVVLPVGLELDELLRLGYRNNDSGLNIGIVGRLTEIKNHRFFLQVAKEFQNKYLDSSIKFKIIGDGHLRSALVDYAGYLGLKNVEFKGWVKAANKIYEELDVVALTSLNEGTPISLIEAMAAARPVVATKIGGVIDIVNEQRGFLVAPGDMQGFVNALDVLLKDKFLRQRLGQSGREFVKNRYTKDVLVENIKQLYQSVLKERKK